MLGRTFPTSRLGVGALFGLLAAAAAFAPGRVPEAFAQEDPACLSEDPADWPAPAKPYFMIVMDTSGSMVQCTNPFTGFPETWFVDRSGHLVGEHVRGPLTRGRLGRNITIALER